MKDIKELALRVAEAAGAKGFHWDGSLFDFVEPFLAAYTAGQEPVHQWRKRTDDRWFDASQEEAYSRVDQYYEARTLFTAPHEPAAPSSEEVREIVKWLNENPFSHRCKQAADRIATLEQQNAELVAALELCKKHMVGDKWDSLFIDGVLSKVKQP